MRGLVKNEEEARIQDDEDELYKSVWLPVVVDSKEQLEDLTKSDPTGSHCLKSVDCCQRPSSAHATCYRHQVLRTTELFVEAAGLQPEQYSVSFQSRLGRAKWLEPSTEHVLKHLAERGIKNLLVLCPAFVTDCLETLEEIEIQGSESFKEAGGETLTLVPCLNAHPDWVHTVAQWITAA